MRILSLVLFLLAVAGCGSSGETVAPDPYALSERRLNSSYERLTAPALDSLSAARRTRFAARRMEEAGLMPALASGFAVSFATERGSEPNPTRAHVLGYVPGRDPSFYGELVVVTANLDAPGAAAVLETARRLALEALDTQVPRRSVLFALWTPPHTSEAGLSDYLAHPTWALDGIEHAIVVAADSLAAAPSLDMLREQGVGASALVSPAVPATSVNREAEDQVEQTLIVLAETLYDRVRDLASSDQPSSEVPQ